MDLAIDWSGCDTVETVPGKVSGEPLLRGTRVAADAVDCGVFRRSRRGG